MKRIAAVCACALAFPASTGAGGSLSVYAASSLGQAFPRIDSRARYTFAGSDQLAFQIEQGAPADVYAAAGPKYPQLLYRDGLVGRPSTFATNVLVVLVPRSNPARIHTVYDLRRRGVKVVIGDRTVPVGAYTRQLLDRLGITASVMRNVVSEEPDVKGIVTKVALGEADGGFVYATDARPVRMRVRSVRLPAWAQPPIRYELAVVKGSAHAAAARRFVAEVLGRRGRAVLRQAGFAVPERRR